MCDEEVNGPERWRLFPRHYQEGSRPFWLQIDEEVRRREGQLATFETLIAAMN